MLDTSEIISLLKHKNRNVWSIYIIIYKLMIKKKKQSPQ